MRLLPSSLNSAQGSCMYKTGKIILPDTKNIIVHRYGVKYGKAIFAFIGDETFSYHHGLWWHHNFQMSQFWGQAAK